MSAPLLQSFGPGNVDEILTTSLENLIPGIKDNVFKSNPVLNWLNNGKNKIRKKGGASLSHGVLYQTNSTAQSYQRYDQIATDPQDGLTRDQWAWAQYAVTLSVDGFSERIANSGSAALEDIVETKKMQSEQSLSLLLEQHIFQAVPGAKDMQSLPVIVASSGTIGGINGTTSTWWASTVTSSGSFAARGRSDMTTAWNTIAITNEAGGPEMIVSDQTSFEAYESSMVPQERITDNKMADIGILNIKFKGTPWTWSPQATSGVIYLLHSDGLEFIVNTDTDFLMTPFVQPYNQVARTAKILLACALATGNRRKLAKLTSVTA